MKSTFRIVLAVLALSAATAHAQNGPPLVSTQTIDPARVDAARPVVDKLFPVGTYKRMMGGVMSKMLDGMMGRMMKMPIAQIARISGVPTDKLTGMDDTTLQQVSAIVDPHFRDRTKLGMDAMIGGMAELMDGFEPNVRNALVRAYARRFDVRQLNEINAFFVTPTGNKFATEYMTMMMDQDILGEMQALMPQMLKKMPDMIERAKKATGTLPPPRTIADLSQVQKDELARLLGVKASELHSRAGEGNE